MLDCASVAHRLCSGASDASATHLRTVFPDAEDTQCRIFHERTVGNPRLQFYLLERAESQGSDALDQAIRLTLIAAELARSNEAANSVIMDQPGVASIYGNPNDVARLYLRDPDKSWLGPAHFEIARVYARDPSYRNRAEEQLRMAGAWIRRWQALPENESFDWHMNAEDVAAGAEAVYRLEGPEKARDWLMRWRPRIVRLRAAYDLAKELAAREHVPTLEKQLTVLGLPVLVEAALSEGGDAPSRESVESVARHLDLASRRAALWDCVDLVDSRSSNDRLHRSAHSCFKPTRTRNYDSTLYRSKSEIACRTLP